jgi:hypothetical protein
LPFIQRVSDILEENREEIAQTFRNAREARSKLMKLLRFYEITNTLLILFLKYYYAGDS